MKLLETVESAPPVFFKVADAPKGVTVEEICEAAERKIGHGNIAGSVKSGLLWRLHGKTLENRANLLADEPPRIIIKKKNSMGKIESYNVPIYSKNPLTSNIVDGKVVPSVKLYIDGFFLSVAMGDVQKNLDKIPGLTRRSPVYYDRAWKADKTLSPWVNGRRYAWIDEPSKEHPLPNKLKVGAFQAYLSYKGMPLKCWDCGGPHRKGDKNCPKSNNLNLSPDTRSVSKPNSLAGQSAAALLQELKDLPDVDFLQDTEGSTKSGAPSGAQVLSGNGNMPPVTDESTSNLSDNSIGDHTMGSQDEEALVKKGGEASEDGDTSSDEGAGSSDEGASTSDEGASNSDLDASGSDVLSDARTMSDGSSSTLEEDNEEEGYCNSSRLNDPLKSYDLNSPSSRGSHVHSDILEATDAGKESDSKNGSSSTAVSITQDDITGTPTPCEPSTDQINDNSLERESVQFLNSIIKTSHSAQNDTLVSNDEQLLKQVDRLKVKLNSVAEEEGMELSQEADEPHGSDFMTEHGLCSQVNTKVFEDAKKGQNKKKRLKKRRKLNKVKSHNRDNPSDSDQASCSEEGEVLKSKMKPKCKDGVKSYNGKKQQSIMDHFGKKRAHSSSSGDVVSERQELPIRVALAKSDPEDDLV